MNTEKLLGDLWAKWDGTSIREHTDKLLENLNLLKSIYGDLINGVLGDLADDFWKALKLACEHHDYGKLHSWFQRKVGNPEFGDSKPSFPEVRHNLLSPAFLPDDIKEPLKTLIAMAIVHHHDYDPSDAVLDKVEEVLKEEFNKELSFTHRKVLKQGEKEILEKLERREGRDLKNFYILLKGFLLRIDHASSSKVSDKVESGRIKETEVRVREYLEKHRGSSLNDLQAFVLQNRDKNLLVRASTGYGKTEAGFIFLKDKGFFTLPIRTSANAIYERAKLMFGNDSVGLLHSTAPLYLIDNSEENRNFLRDTVVKDIFLTRNFGKPLIVSTPDQIFPFILRPGGFEKYYSLLSYARVVLDEVQLFEPHTLGFIVKAAEKINSMGGRVMIMTATLPEYVRKDLACIDLAEGVFLNSEPRHNVRLVGNSLLSEEGLNFIKELSKRGKVLVVVNTKSRAIQLGKRLESGKLLHSFFTHRDRRKKEKLIEDFFKGSDCGVWITTQIAEVSLDLDADFLVTELSTVDSLLQRMGRVNRKGDKSAEEPNVFVFTEECSGIGSVYRKSIHMFTKDSLKEGIITEKEKQELMEKVYRRVAEEDADYVRRYEEAKGYIDSLWNLEESFSKRKAQEMFRDILSVNVIPEVFKEDLESLIKTYRRETDYVEKVKAFSELTGYMFSVPSYTKVPMERVEGVKDVFWIKGNYSPELGFEPKDEDGNII